MRCPVCKQEMVVLELEGVEIDYCLDCGGVWLDAGELELLLGSKEKTEETLSALFIEKNIKEERRKCPICLKKMGKVRYGGKVIVDKCENNDGLWFDKGELEEVLRIEGGKDNKILNLLKETFPSNNQIN